MEGLDGIFLGWIIPLTWFSSHIHFFFFCVCIIIHDYNQIHFHIFRQPIKTHRTETKAYFQPRNLKRFIKMFPSEVLRDHFPRVSMQWTNTISLSCFFMQRAFTIQVTAKGLFWDSAAHCQAQHQQVRLFIFNKCSCHRVDVTTVMPFILF